MRPDRTLLPCHGTRILVLALGLIGVVPLSAQAAQPASEARAAAVVDARAAAVVVAARALIGAPYAYIGADPTTGFSCIGFVHYVYAQIGVNVPYDLALAYAAGPRVPRAALQPGDLVFFSNTVWNGLSHVALYAGDDMIIGADNYATGVEMTHLSNRYWTAHYTGATRPLQGATEIQPPTSGPTPVPTATPQAPRPLPPLPAPVLRMRAGQLLRGGVPADVYSGPGYTYLSIDRLAPHATVRVVAQEGPWTNVAYDGAGMEYYGWVDAVYLAACSIIAPPASHPSTRRDRRAGIAQMVIVAVPVLYLRRGPARNQPILGRLHAGEQLALLGRQGAWDHVRARGMAMTGWAFARWLVPAAMRRR